MLMSLTIWLFQTGEPLPLGDAYQPLRTGMLARRLSRMGHKVVWFASRFEHGTRTHRPKEQTEIAVDSNFTIRLLDGPGYASNTSAQRVLHHVAMARDFLRIASQLEKPDVLVSSYPTPEVCLATLRFAKKQNIPIIVDVRDPWPDSFQGTVSTLKGSLLQLLGWHYRRAANEVLRNATSVVSMSETMLRWSLKYANRPRCDSDRVYYLGYEDTGIERQEADFPKEFTAANPLVAIFYGMFGKFHNGQVVVEVARRFSERKDSRIKFVMAGDGDLRADWEAQATGLLNISFTGWISGADVHRELSRSHIGFVTISGGVNKYWFGNKLFEYLGHGLAIVNDTQGEVAELITANDIGRNISEGNAGEIEKALMHYLENPYALCQSALRSRKLFVERFSADRIYDDYCGYIIDIAQHEKEVPHEFNARINA